jgi:cephalosporin-C deacetylase-like acetyl esterase
LFGYDPHAPLNCEVLSLTAKDGYSIRDVAYTSPLGGKVPAYLVMPEVAKAPFPAIIFAHSGQGNRASFLPEAESYAAMGVASLLVDAPFVREKASGDSNQASNGMHMLEKVTDTATHIQLVVDVRRGIDLLAQFPEVDHHRLLYVGHSYGATWGGVLAGIETRIKGYVLMAGHSRGSAWHESSTHPLAAFIRQHLPQERLHSFLSALEPMDAVYYVKNAAPSSLYFQFVHDDEYVSREQAACFYDAASFPKKISWYHNDHHFSKPDDSCRDRTEWILEQFSLR